MDVPGGSSLGALRWEGPEILWFLQYLRIGLTVRCVLVTALYKVLELSGSVHILKRPARAPNFSASFDNSCAL